MSRRERPIDPRDGSGEDEARETLDWHGKPTWAQAPMTTMGALMEAAPGEEPQRSREELAALKETIAEAIDNLPGYEREVFEGLFIEKATYRALADRLGVGVATIDRMKQRAIALLQDELGDKVAEWLR